MELMLENEKATQQFAEDLALCLKPGDLITLSGDLGAGKSTLARAVIRALANNPRLEVPSPTFTLMQVYDETRLPLAHADIYRLEMEEEVEELGFAEFLETGVILVEWPEKAPHLLANAQFQLELQETLDDARLLTIQATANAQARLEHSLEIREFLNNHDRQNVHRSFLQGDASTRCYEKLQFDDEARCPNTEILMDAPDHEIHDTSRALYIQKTHLATTTEQFSDIAKILYNNGFKAPEIFAENSAKTLLIIEDLGDDGVIDANRAPIAKRYIACAEFLAKFHSVDWQQAIKQQNYVLPAYDQTALMTEANLLPEWYYGYKMGKAVPDAWQQQYQAIWQPVFDKVQQDEKTLVMRDFHSPNILWQQHEEGVKHIGLIDFQDAVLGSPAYDLVSLGQDARVNVSPELEHQVIEAYLTARITFSPDFDARRFLNSYAILGAQRASKILGIFVRLKQRDGKSGYIQHLPRIEEYLQRNLNTEILLPLKQFLQKSGLF